MNAVATGNDAVALGYNATATANNAVALGANSVANQANTVSVGAPGAERRITNVAEGVQGTDAVNLNQLNRVAKIAYSGTAMSLAMSGAVLPPMEAGDYGVGVGLGTYRNYSAVGVTLRYIGQSGSTAWSVGVAGSQSGWAGHMGFGYKWK